MRHRFLSFLLLSVGFLFLIPVVEFSFVHHAVWPGGIYSVDGTGGSQFSSPGWALLNLTCNGRIGRVVVTDDITGKTLLNASVHGHGQFVVVLPHAGDYSDYGDGSNTSITCTDQLWSPYATKRVQETSYLGSSMFFLLFALAVWRWRA
ncbi:hypothetical protein [Thermococcus sp. Bubb.Bath]|uniref:hypothetical protein n=1 Tax=Thermococcus sp. Bubb.Bath TaxID=1638242 RepID=UPI00143B2FEB|nr:hypothetical protein [Thermococcus sp. Bubb.Bath]NJF25495.1 hypothetical protein [Thermococcus sp. Bubb.Bath]